MDVRKKNIKKEEKRNTRNLNQVLSIFIVILFTFHLSDWLHLSPTFFEHILLHIYPDKGQYGNISILLSRFIFRLSTTFKLFFLFGSKLPT